MYAKLKSKTGLYLIWIEKKNYGINIIGFSFVFALIWLVLLKTTHSFRKNWTRTLVISPCMIDNILFEKFIDRYYRQLLKLYSQRHTWMWSTPLITCKYIYNSNSKLNRIYSEISAQPFDPFWRRTKKKKKFIHFSQ